MAFEQQGLHAFTTQFLNAGRLGQKLPRPAQWAAVERIDATLAKEIEL
ncbi:MAG TPA: hypothetical protein VGC12_02605 [Methyloradius sp.]